MATHAPTSTPTSTSSPVPDPVSAPYAGIFPRIDAPLVHAGPGAAVLGRATIGAGLHLQAYAVVRADGDTVDIGRDVFLGVHSTVHISGGNFPTTIGDHVSAGVNAVIHACEIGDNCVIGTDAVVLDGSVVGAGAALEAGSTVYPRSRLEGGWLYGGQPAKPIRKLTADERADLHEVVRKGASGGNDAERPDAERPDARSLAGDGVAGSHDLDCFVASGAFVRGAVRVGRDVGIWYGCRLLAGAGRIAIGARSNIQDNSVLIADTGDVTIGDDVTIGHNVTLDACEVRANSLVGIGAVLAPGSVVESDVLVAAGAHSEAGQRLEAGWLWAGRPARPIRKLDDARRAMLADTVTHYRDYAATFRATPHERLFSRV